VGAFCGQGCANKWNTFAGQGANGGQGSGINGWPAGQGARVSTSSVAAAPTASSSWSVPSSVRSWTPSSWWGENKEEKKQAATSNSWDKAWSALTARETPSEQAAKADAAVDLAGVDLAVVDHVEEQSKYLDRPTATDTDRGLQALQLGGILCVMLMAVSGIRRFMTRPMASGLRLRQDDQEGGELTGESKTKEAQEAAPLSAKEESQLFKKYGMQEDEPSTYRL